MRTKKIYSFFLFLLLMLLESVAFSFEKGTHSKINEYIARNTIRDFSLNDFISQQLRMRGGIEEILNKEEKKQEIWQWLAEGGETEDEPDGFSQLFFNKGRSNNHFHNPLKPWNEAGLNDTVLGLRYTGQSSVMWAQNPEQTAGGKWSWQDARRYYYEGLVSLTKSVKDAAFANTFRALGQLMHLVQDASVPAHVRNQIHIRYNYESWLQDIWAYEKEKFRDFLRNPISFDKSILNLLPNSFAPLPIARVFDADQYDGTNPYVTTSNSIGIAEYTHANFFSEGTVFSKEFPYPGLTSVEEADYFIPDPRDESKTVLRRYYKKVRDGETGYRMATVNFLRNYITKYFQGYTGLERKALDGGVYEDYAQRLLPRAVGYSAGLLEYFFRGRLQVTSLPIFYENGLYLLKVKIKNITPNEDMKYGYFILTYRYTPPGGPEDGSGDIFNYAFSLDGELTLPCIELKSGEEMEVYFRIFWDYIPIETLNSVKLTLAFQGTLGNETGAVLGKVFSAGKVLFNEEWDKGLHGNHTWKHRGIDIPYPFPEAGWVSNTVEEGFLQKEHVVFEPVLFSLNESTVGVSSSTDQYQDVFPLLVTPNTYLQFKIDDISISYSPVPPTHGYADHYQCLRMDFNHGMGLLFSQGEYDPVVDHTRDAHYLFSLGYIIVDNIYRLFQDAGITIPEGPLYLYSIGFHQLLFSTQKDIEYHERMKVNFVRIIEAKEE